MARSSGKDVEWDPITFPPLSETFKSTGFLNPELQRIEADDVLQMLERAFDKFAMREAAPIDVDVETRSDVDMDG